MDENLPVQTQPTGVLQTPPPQVPRRLSKKVISLGIFSCLLFLVGGLVLLLPKKPPSAKRSVVKKDGITQPPTAKSRVQHASSFLFGAWSANQSVIYRFDPTSHTQTQIASFPLTVKKVQALPDGKLIAITNTNSHDAGTAISLLTLSTNQLTDIVTADPGFGIDDYVLSPNGEFLVYWELQLNDKTGKVKGGKSRVYSLAISQPQTKNLLYDEGALADPIHYPLAVTNAKDVFVDSYLPNTGPGFGYGMSVSNFDGTQQTIIPSMVNGTYSSQPRLASDGTYLLFSGYDGSNGDGTLRIGNVRTALADPNTIELFNLQTKKRERLPNLPQNTLFLNVMADPNNRDSIFFQSMSTNEAPGSVVYHYSLKQQKGTRIVLPKGNTSVLAVVSPLSQNTLLLGDQVSDQTKLGNLGYQYAMPYTSFYVFDTDTRVLTQAPLPLTNGLLTQFIQTLPDTGANVLGDETNSLQIKSFMFDTVTPIPTVQPVIKPDLNTERANQQTAPEGTTDSGNSSDDSQNDDVTAAQCKLAGVTPCDRLTIRKMEQCDDICSPLYLYGPSGTKMTVRIGTAITNSHPASNGLYTTTLLGGGNMAISGQEYTKIAYDYTPRLMPFPLPYGTIVSSATLMQTLSWYAKNLGLNEKETADVLSFAKDTLITPFTMISFYDEKTSEMMLPLSFDPQPDTYRNVVFYFQSMREIPLHLPQQPIFPPKLIRQGITAIEVSEYLEK